MLNEKTYKRSIFGGCSLENIVGLVLWILLLLSPFILSMYVITNMVYFFAMSALSLSVVLIWGYCGIFSFGQSAFFGLAAYSYALVSLNLQNNPLGPCIAIIVALIIPALLAAIVGAMMFYGGVNDVFVGLITMCITLVLNTFMSQTAGDQWRIGDAPLGGYNGINNIPTLGGLGPISMFYFCAILLCLIFWWLRHFTHTKTGRIAVSIRENSDRSALLGYSVPWYRTVVFILGSLLAAVGGILFVNWGSYITPAVFELATASIPVVLVAAAGRQNVTGTLLFTIIYYWISTSLSASGSRYAQIILGVILIVSVLFVPKGIMTWTFEKFETLIQIPKKSKTAERKA